MRIHQSGIRRATFVGGIFFVATLALFLMSHLVRADSLSFSGTVTFPNGSPFTEGGGVNIGNSSGWKNSPIYQDGTFSITGVSAGIYTLDVGLNNSSSYANPPQQQVTITQNVSGFHVAVATPVIRGTLANPDGTPTSGCVNVRDRSYTINRNSCPGSDGGFKIGSLDAGEYILSTQPSENSPYVASEQTVTITNPAATLDLGLVRLDTPFVVGTVALPDGTLVPWNDSYSLRLHLSVDLWNSENTVNRHSDFDANSKFKFGQMPAGTYTIHVNIWDTDLYTGSANTTITVTTSGLDMTASPLRLTIPQLVGTVYRPDGVTPMQGVWINLRNSDGSLNQGSSSDQYGKYRIGGLPAGTYSLEVNPPNDQTDVARPDPVSITITTSATTRDITLTAAKKFVQGTVKRSNGTAVSCANVNANRRDGNGWASSSTRSDGSYTLTLTPGSWSIRVEPNYGFSCPQPDWIFLDSEAVVTFSNDGSSQTETVSFVVEKTTAKIVGKVTLKNGTVVTNGNVNANSQTADGRNRWSNAQIKSDGTYTLNLIAGTYDLNVWTSDNRQYVRSQKVTLSNNQTLTANFTVNEKLAHITGVVSSKDGKLLPNIQINGNLDCGPNGCTAWSNTRTDSEGRYDMAVTAGRWFLNFDSGQGAAYVYDGPQVDVAVPTETSTVSGINFSLTYADVTIKGDVVTEDGQIFSDFPGWAYVRPVTVTSDTGMREYGGPVNRGSFEFRVPSRLFSLAEMGVHAPQNSQYSAAAGTPITLVADATIEKNIIVKKNDAAITGRLLGGSGMPLSSCNFRGEVFANTEGGEWHGTQINPDCTYEISLLAGTYRVGSHIEESAGFLNQPQMDNLLTVNPGTRVQYDIKVLAGDARVAVRVLNPDGSPARRVWVNADNHEEVDAMRQSGQQGTSDNNFRGPGNTKSPQDLLNYCSKKEHEKECKDFKLPPGSEGPGKCKDALACTQYCQKHKTECQKTFEGKQPAAAKSVHLSGSVQRLKASIASLKPVKAQATSTDTKDAFDAMIQTGSETNDTGVATISLLSKHQYTINAGVPTESNYMPPKTERVDLTQSTSASLTLFLRESDGSMSGFVTHDGKAVLNGYVGCWGEDSSNNGSPINNGTYKLNYTFGTTYHCNANSSDGTTFLQSEEQMITVATEKKKKVNFTLGEAKFQIPPSVSETFDSTEPHVITLADGTTINIPANALAQSGNVTVNANPTINIRGQKTAQPLGYGYQLEATDADGKAITTFNSSITMCFTYTNEMLTNAGIDESSLVSSYWDSASSSWKLPPNATHDTTNKKICISSNHFTAYALVSTSGKGRGQQLTAVQTSTKNGITKVTVGSGKKKVTITPFPRYKGSVDVVTLIAGKKTGQVIIAGMGDRTSAATIIKVYSLKGKLTQTIRPYGNGYTSGVKL
ncbi:MAG: carboxypeptidase-like regulatory domain-containing protein, partial [bacterium]